MKTLKKLDIVIILFLIVLSFIPQLIFSKTLSADLSTTYANITLAGNFYDNIPLSSFKGEKTFVIKTKYGKNTILVKDDTIQIVDADCKDSLCVNQGIASKVGQSIICLPHKLIIEIKGDEKDSSYDMILSH